MWGKFLSCEDCNGKIATSVWENTLKKLIIPCVQSFLCVLRKTTYCPYLKFWRRCDYTTKNLPFSIFYTRLRRRLYQSSFSVFHEKVYTAIKMELSQSKSWTLKCTRLPPMCPGFDFQTRCHMWVEFVSALRGFSPGTPVFLSLLKPAFD